MGKLIAQRFLWMLLVLLVVAFTTFILMHAVPGGPFSREKPLPPQTLAQNVTLLLELEKSSFVDLMMVRQALEVTAARLAATQATPEELLEIAGCAHAMREVAEGSGNEKDKYFDYGAKDLDFHRLIARASFDGGQMKCLPGLRRHPQANAGLGFRHQLLIELLLEPSQQVGARFRECRAIPAG